MKNLYHSTRNNKLYIHEREAIIKGIAEDGGLYVLDSIGEKTLCLEEMLEDNYFMIAQKVMKRLLPGFHEEELQECIQVAYAKKFDNEEITPLRKVGKDYFLELFHGPTSAFKDIGLQMLPQLMSNALQHQQDQKVMILTATSGDTGKAALEGFQDVKKVGITVFYPKQGVSAIQQLQMVTQTGDNVAVCALEGNFDDAQSQVKKLFHDEALKQSLAEDNIVLSSANSINIGRLIPQVVYYVYSYLQMVKRGEIKLHDEMNFCVPTGNFGNVLAGYYAKLMGLPVHRFLVASNANNVLYDFFNEGVYNRQRPFYKTISPSMDILVSSNLERLLYYVSDFDCEQVSDYMKQLQQTGRYEIKEEWKQKMQQDFYAGYSSDEDTRKAIKEVYEKTGYVMDPHTAVGYKVMKEYQKIDQRPCVLLSTASPYKFSDQVYEAIFHEQPPMDEFSYMSELAKKTKTKIPENLVSLQGKKKRFSNCIKKAEMKTYIIKKSKEIFHD